MYLGTRKILNPEEHERRSSAVMADKAGAVWNAFAELEGLLSKSQIASQYFGKSQGWLSQKLNGCTVCDKQRQFTEEEYHQLAEAFRHIARRLEGHADEIESALMK